MMNQTKSRLIKNDHKVFFLVLIISFSIFIFTASAHRFTSDDYLGYSQAERIINQTPIPNFIPGETRPGLQGSNQIEWSFSTCKDPIICSKVPLVYSMSFIPFIQLEQNLNILPDEDLTLDDFDDNHYVWWRNTLSNEETFTFLFYGPVITAISTAILFAICRTYNFSIKIAITVAFLYGFTTMAWAYSSTALSVILVSMTVLLSFYFYRKFVKNQNFFSLIFCGFSLGASVLVRYDSFIIVVIILVFLIGTILRNKSKLKNLTCLLIPLFFCAIIFMGINYIQFGTFLEYSFKTESGYGLGPTSPIHVGVFGLLFSPGAGLFIFSPILFTIFVSFFDFYKKDKSSFLIFSAYFVSMLVFFGNLETWHGFVSWGPRYLLPVIPFLLIPLAASIEKRNSIGFRFLVIVLGAIGAFFSLIWLIQDVTWFTWGVMGGDSGLYSLGMAGIHSFSLNPLVFWTFEYSQLVQSINLAFNHLQVDLFLFKLLGPIVTALVLSVIIIPLVFILKSVVNNSKLYVNKNT
jgi:hypothetical protein